MTATPTPTGAAPKKARRKVTTDLGRQLLTRERQRLSREQAALAEQQLLEAERRRTQQKRNTRSAKPIDVAINRSIVKRFAGVLASEGISVRISCTPSHTTSAWTDFEQIVINYTQQDDARILAANLRGLAYHEGGHCRFTLPYLQLAEAAGVTSAPREYHRAWNCLEDQRMETAVTSDSPRKAAYLTSMVMLDMVPSVNHAAANWPLLIWRRFLPKHIRTGARKLFVVRHGVDGEQLAQDLERVTTKYVLADNAVTMWEAVVEYEGLLQLTQPMAAGIDDQSMGHGRQYKRSERNLDDYLVIPIAGDMLDDGGNGGTIDMDDDAEYEVDLTDPQVAAHLYEVLYAAMWAPETLIPVIFQPQGGKGEQGEGEGNSPSAPKDENKSEAGAAGDDEGDDTEGADGDGGGDDDGLTYANEPRSNDKGEQAEGGSTGTHKNTGVREGLDYKPEDAADEAGAGAEADEAESDLTEDDLSKAIADAEAERNKDAALDGDVDAFHNAINERVSDLMPYTAGISTDVEAQASADNLAQDIEQAFQENTIEKAPGWVQGERRGIINVLRYETRRPGDVEFFKAYTDTEAPGHNIAVSVLLDYSGSMCSSTKELAQCGYATKKACDALGIPCTITLWDTDAVTLYDANEQAESLPVIVANGGTDPSVALADLDRQRYDKEVHIVLIMTDGAWSGSCATTGFLANYSGDGGGRYFLGIGYASHGWGGGSADEMANNLRRYGCDEAHGISNLMEVPRFLEQALVAFS